MTEPPDQPNDPESLSRALRAPGSESELREEQEYVAMFRSAQAAPAPRGRRAVSRFGAGTAFVVALAVGGSAAAAYTNHLPEPIQRFAHRALGPVAPPAPTPTHHHARDHVTATDRTPTPTPSETGTPSSTPSQSPTSAPSPMIRPTGHRAASSTEASSPGTPCGPSTTAPCR